MRLKIILFSIIFLFGFFTKIARLDIPPQPYFDEVYHAFTAQNYLTANKDAYNPWSHPPKGFAYAWNHPPLGNLLSAFWMKIFGTSAAASRLSSVISGQLAGVFIFLIAFELFKSFFIASLSMVFFYIEGLAFTQSRISTLDMPFAAVALISIYLLLKWQRKKFKLSFSNEKSSVAFFTLLSISLGTALAIKWTGLYLSFFLIVFIVFHELVRSNPLLNLKLFSRGTKTSQSQTMNLRFIFPLLLKITSLTVIALMTYILSYSQYFYLGYSFSDFMELHRQMFLYHLHLKATHAYQSEPWQWILNLRPIWYYVNYVSETKIANIYSIGNSVVFLSGLTSICFCILKWLETKKMAFLFIFYWFGAFWIPWLFSPRISFFYYYLPAVPFLCIALGWLVSVYFYSNSRLKKSLSIFLVIGALLWFVLFYPHMTALPVSKAFAQKVYFAIPSWK